MNMDDNSGNRFNFGGNRQNLNQLSPYLNIDPAYLRTQAPEYIVSNDMKRGKLENTFSGVGSALFIGAATGGTYGFFDGVRQTALAELKGRTRRTQILNHTLKSGATVGNSLGAVALMYSTLYCLMSVQFEEYDEAMHLTSGAVTGALFKSSGGLKKAGMGGAIGLGLAALWSFGFSKNETVRTYV